MRITFIPFLSIFLLAFVFVPPNLIFARHHCDVNELSTFSNLTTSHESNRAPHHHEDSHCSFHHLGCHQGAAYVKEELVFQLPNQFEINDFSASNSIIKPSPFLDGPFQPPRA